MSIWDDPELRSGGEFVSFEQVGDTVSGTLNAVRAHRFNPNEAAVPQLLLTTDGGEEKTVTCGQVRLKAELSQQRPEAGDHITITLSDIEKRQGGKTLKHFKVEVRRGGNTQAASAAQPAQQQSSEPQQIDPAAAMAALGNLTDEQKKALGIGV